MTLATNSANQDFDSVGLQNAISFTPTGAINLGDGIYSGATSATHATIDNSTLKAPMARLILEALDGFTLGTWNATPQFKIYQRIMQVDGTNDEPVPDGSSNSRYVGRFIVDQDTGVQRVQAEAPVNMVGVKKCQFHILNDTGASLDDDNVNGWKVRVELMSYVPKSA